MKFENNLVHGYFVKRYMRFLVDVKLDSGEIVTAHCTNSGSMKSCLEEDAEVYMSPVNDPKRKTKFTWEMIKINSNWVGINTSNPNTIAFQWMKAGIIPGLDGYSHIQREVTFGDSRFDIFAKNDKEECFVEVKNVTLKEGEFALFPDAKTTRGQKHLETLIDVKKSGKRAVMLYVIQRMDVSRFAPAVQIDNEYTKKLIKAAAEGVEIIPMQVKVSPQQVDFHKIIDFSLK
jgi:sugar fermentation stimulation protein A